MVGWFVWLSVWAGSSHKIQRILQAADIQVRHSSSNKLHSILHCHKDKHPNHKKAGVYKISCECGKVYIGETGWNLETRLKEHRTSFGLSDWDKSAIVKHAQQHEHTIEWTTVILSPQWSTGIHAESEKPSKFTATTTSGNPSSTSTRSLLLHHRLQHRPHHHDRHPYINHRHPPNPQSSRQRIFFLHNCLATSVKYTVQTTKDRV